MALADAARAKQHDVLGALDEGEGRELLDLCARRAAREAEVVLLERLDRRQRRELQLRLARALAARVDLRTEQLIEEIGVGLFPGRSGLRACGRLRGLALELQARAQHADAFLLQAHARTSSSCS
jgi:hypothetical protein